MKINTTSRHYDLTPALKEYAEAKIEHLSTFFDHLDSAHIVFSLEKYRHMIEVTLHANGREFVAHETTDDMYTSVDRSVDKLERQLRRHKEKVRDRKSNQSLAETAAEAEEQVEQPDEEGEAL